MKWLLDMSNKLSSMGQDDSNGHSMQTHNALNVQLCILLHLVEGMHENEVVRHGKSINNNPNGIILAGRER
jgi:hypothetical protein